MTPKPPPRSSTGIRVPPDLLARVDQALADETARRIRDGVLGPPPTFSDVVRAGLNLWLESQAKR